MAISLADILDERQVALQLRSRRKSNAIRELVVLLEKRGRLALPGDLFAEVAAREKRGSTLADDGVAFPHARTELVENVPLAIGRSRAGIPWNDEGERARLIYLLAVPKRLVKEYLVLVGTLARVTTDQEHQAALFAATTAEEFTAILRDAASF
jgi:mannitol/fructose-specific phosphotransferase system IIA component (Ntr-type)